MRKPSEVTHLSSGIPELNNILTRDDYNGIAIPGKNQVASSTIVIKGPAGTGKSVLSSILAYNLHCQVVTPPLTEQESKSIFDSLARADQHQHEGLLSAIRRAFLAQSGQTDERINLGPIQSATPEQLEEYRASLLEKYRARVKVYRANRKTFPKVFQELQNHINLRNGPPLRQLLPPDYKWLAGNPWVELNGLLDILVAPPASAPKRLRPVVKQPKRGELPPANQIPARTPFILPFAVYFSYAQSSEGIAKYLAELLPKPQPEDKRLYPLIISPSDTRGVTETGGVSLLRRFLVDNLAALHTSPFGLKRTLFKTWKELRDFLSTLENSRLWHFATPLDQVLPASPGQREEEKAASGIPDYMAEILSECPVELLPIIIVDPINFFFDYRDSRAAIAELFQTFRMWRWPLIVALEDARDGASETDRQLASYVEFEADTVISLNLQPGVYARRSIEVMKNRNAAARLGRQFFRIETEDHSLSNVLKVITEEDSTASKAEEDSQKPDPATASEPQKDWFKDFQAEHQGHPGVMIFPSIHWHLSKSRKRLTSDQEYRTGISLFDTVLQSNSSTLTPEEPNVGLLPSDAFILVRGPKGAHKLSVAFNLLVAGAWDYRKEEIERKVPSHTIETRYKSDLETSQSVMLLSLGEETRIRVSSIALSFPPPLEASLWSQGLTDRQYDNGKMLLRVGEDPDGNGKMLLRVGEDPATNLMESQGQHKKVIVDQWSLIPTDPTEAPVSQKLVLVSFKPGYSSADEFFWVVESLVKQHRPSRLLFENTAHLRMRFPALYEEKMLFAALSSLTHSKQTMLIVSDVEGSGSDDELSYALSTSADYIFSVDSWKIEDARNELCKSKYLPAHCQNPGLTFGTLFVSNVRGKNYRREPLVVTVAWDMEARQNKLFTFRLPISLLNEKLTKETVQQAWDEGGDNALLPYS